MVRFDTDCAFEPTADDAGSNDELDSDATAFGHAYGRCLAITRTIQLASGATVTNVDFGVVNATEPDPCRC